MADIIIVGHIEGIRYSETCVYVTVSENRLGYKRSDGVIVDDDILTWRVVYKPYFKKYIASHFDKGMLVKIKGMVLPYTRNQDGSNVEGYTIIGQTIDLSAYPRSTTIRQERKLVKDSMSHDIGTPNIDAYNEPDF